MKNPPKSKLNELLQTETVKEQETAVEFLLKALNTGVFVLTMIYDPRTQNPPTVNVANSLGYQVPLEVVKALSVELQNAVTNLEVQLRIKAATEKVEALVENSQESASAPAVDYDPILSYTSPDDFSKP